MSKPKFSYFVFLYESGKCDEPFASFETFEAAKVCANNHRDHGAKVVQLAPTVVYSIYEPIKK